MDRITHAACQAGRDPREVRLLAVSKTFPPEAVASLAACGQRAFGENYVQEGVAKVQALQALDLEWHFIGPIQSNKTRLVAEHFDWVHSVERLKIAERLSAQRPEDRPPLKVLLQVNVSGEDSKSGCAPAEVPELARQLVALPRLQLVGLMAIPEPTTDTVLLRQRFARLRELREALALEGIGVPELSMGMSADLEVAITEGASWVRVGSALFGQRNKLPPA